MMKCGHAASAVEEPAGRPVCAICIGLHPGATEVAKKPDLTGRRAGCRDCKTTTESSTVLAFFSHNPGGEMDSYYCGCRGWD